MAAKILDGKKSSEKWLSELSAKIKTLPSPPSIALVRVGDDPASEVYVRSKHRACEKIGIMSRIIHLPASTTQGKLLARIKELNADKSINGILVQVPLPGHIDPIEVQKAIHPFKDVDGFGPKNMGYLLMGRPRFAAATPAGIMRLLSDYKLKLAGKHAVVVGRSNIVGKPLAQLLLMEDATVTIAHSKTKNLGAITRQADFLFVAAGKPNLVRANMVKKGAVVVDVGMNKIGAPSKKPELEEGAQCKSKNCLVGDVDFEKVSKLASWITPVPGGVGPMTIASLLANTLKACQMQNEK